jgi:hypothetical protein
MNAKKHEWRETRFSIRAICVVRGYFFLDLPLRFSVASVVKVSKPSAKVYP